MLAEPLACAVHVARRAFVEPGASLLVVGAGAVGLLVLHALRALTPAGRITVVAKHPRQVRAGARARRRRGGRPVRGPDGGAPLDLRGPPEPRARRGPAARRRRRGGRVRRLARPAWTWRCARPAPAAASCSPACPRPPTSRRCGSASSSWSGRTPAPATTCSVALDLLGDPRLAAAAHVVAPAARATARRSTRPPTPAASDWPRSASTSGRKSSETRFRAGGRRAHAPAARAPRRRHVAGALPARHAGGLPAGAAAGPARRARRHRCRARAPDGQRAAARRCCARACG